MEQVIKCKKCGSKNTALRMIKESGKELDHLVVAEIAQERIYYDFCFNHRDFYVSRRENINIKFKEKKRIMHLTREKIGVLGKIIFREEK